MDYDRRLAQDAEHAAELLELGDAFFELDGDWRIVRVNRRQEELSRKPRSQTVGRIFAEVWPELATPSSPYWREYDRCMRERVPVQFQAHYAPLDLWTGVSGYPVSTGGIAVFFRDITAMKHAEREQARLAAIVESTEDAVISKNLDGVIVTWNDGAERLFGYTADEVIGRPISLLLPVDRRGEEDRILAELRAGRRVDHFETRRLRKDGAVVDVSVSVSPLRNASGELVGASKIARDITDERRARQALRASEQRLRAAHERLRVQVESMPLAVVEWDSQYRVVGYSRRAQEMFGWGSDEVIGKRIDEIPWIPEEDWPGVRAVMRDMTSGARPTNVHANRNLRKDGKILSCEWYNSTLHDEDGRLVAVLSLVLDVTERERALAALRASEQRLRAMFEDAAVGIVEVDTEDRFVAVNTRFCDMLGHARDDLIGRTLHDITAPEDREVTRELNAKGHAGDLSEFEYEKRYVKRDGSKLWVQVNVRVVKDASGRFVRAVGTAQDITARKRAEEALRESEVKFRSVFEQAAIGMGRVRFDDARWTDVNDAFCRMVGRSREEMLSTPWTEMTHREDLALDLVRFRRMAAGELDSYTVEKRFIHSDGHHVWAKLTLSLVRDANGGADYEIAIIEDITDRKVAEQQLRVSRSQLEGERARLQAIIDTIPTGLIMLDEHGAMVLENPEWKRTWAGNALVDSGVDYDSYKGFRPETGERISADEWPCAISLKKGERTRDVVLDIERFDGTRGTIVVSSAPIRDETGRVISAVAANMDITELRAAQARLQEADRRKDEFLGMLSHELRNPLAPIRNSLYILDHAEPNGHQARRAKEVANRQVAHLTRLVDDLLDVTRIARGKIELRRAKLDLGALASGTAEDYRALMHERGVDLVVAVPREALVVDGDETRLAQVLGNLLSNAAKFTPRGGRVTLAVQKSGGRAVAHVRDTGVGIAPDLLPSIFEPFTQAKQTLARSEGGLGLGLALVKGLTELHGGRVSASSGPGAGTEFTVELPLLQAADTAQPSQRVAGARRSYRVLVVDDNVDAAESLAELVRLFGHEVEVAYDGPSAVATVVARRPDVVLCDIGLPGMDGYEVARALRAKLDGQVQLVAVSGYAQPEDVKKSAEAGFDAHIAKPPDPAHIERLFA